MGRRWNGEGKYLTVQIRGEKVDINVDRDGEFSGKIGLDYHRSDTLKGLLSKLRSSANKLKITVAVPATLIHVSKYDGEGLHKKYLGETCRPVILTSINPKTDDINYVDAITGDKGSTGRYTHSSKLGKPMTPEDIKQWELLYVAQQKADRNFRKFEGKFTGESDDYRKPNKRYDAREVVAAAIQAKADEIKEDETDEEDGDPRTAGSRSRTRRRTPVLVSSKG